MGACRQKKPAGKPALWFIHTLHEDLKETTDSEKQNKVKARRCGNMISGKASAVIHSYRFFLTSSFATFFFFNLQKSKHGARKTT